MEFDFTVLKHGSIVEMNLPVYDRGCETMKILLKLYV